MKNWPNMPEYRNATFGMIVALHVVAGGLVLVNFIQLYGERKVNAEKLKTAITIFAYLTFLVIAVTGTLFILGWADNRI